MNNAKRRAVVGLVAIIGVAAAAVLAIVGMPFGNGSPEAFAHSPCDSSVCDSIISASTPMHLHLDADLADGFCTAPYDATVAVGTSHQVGVCVEDYPANTVESFELIVTYDGTLNDGPEVANVAPALDDNPDANDGSGSDKLGTGWDCTALGFTYPTMNDGSYPATSAHIVCNANVATPDEQLADNPGLLATLNFDATSVGTDTLVFQPHTGLGITGYGSFDCGETTPMGCFGATIDKVPDLGIVKTVDTSPVLAGGSVQFNLALSDNSGGPTASLVFDDLANSLVYDDAATDAANGGNYCDPALGAPAPVPGGDSGLTPEVVCGDALALFSAGTLPVNAPSSLKIVADVPVDLAGKSAVNAALLLPPDPNMANNASVAVANVAAADVSITKTADKAVYSEGDVITWTVTATSNGPSPASSVAISDVADANQSITSCVVDTGDPCVTTATTASASLALPLASGSSATMTITANVVGSAGNACVNDATVEWADPLSDSVHASVTCLPPTVRMEKDVDTDATSIIDATNLFLEKDGSGNLVPLTIYELVSNPGNDPDGVGAYEFDLKYDNHIFDISISDTGWLSNGGTRAVTCSMTIITENDIRWGCVSSGPTPGQTAAGVAAIITVTPKADLVLRLTPGQKNGVFSPLLDEGCELADVYGDPLALASGALAPGVLPGGQIAVCSDMGITVRILEGDLNLDCVVDALDQQAIAFRYGSVFGNLYYSSWYDLEPWNKDYDIDIKDLQKVWGRQGSDCADPIPAQDPLPLPDP